MTGFRVVKFVKNKTVFVFKKPPRLPGNLICSATPCYPTIYRVSRGTFCYPNIYVGCSPRVRRVTDVDTYGTYWVRPSTVGYVQPVISNLPHDTLFTPTPFNRVFQIQISILHFNSKFGFEMVRYTPLCIFKNIFNIITILNYILNNINQLCLISNSVITCK